MAEECRVSMVVVPESEHLRTDWIARHHNLRLLNDNPKWENRPFLIGLYHLVRLTHQEWR